MILLKLFDYIYYRLNRFYLKRDNDSTFTAAMGVSMIQSMIILLIGMVFTRLLSTRTKFLEFGTPLTIIFSILFILLLIINMNRYRDKYSLFANRWSNEDIFTRQIRGLLVVVALLFPVILMVLFAIVNGITY